MHSEPNDDGRECVLHQEYREGHAACVSYGSSQRNRGVRTPPQWWVNTSSCDEFHVPSYFVHTTSAAKQPPPPALSWGKMLLVEMLCHRRVARAFFTISVLWRKPAWKFARGGVRFCVCLFANAIRARPLPQQSARAAACGDESRSKKKFDPPPLFKAFRTAVTFLGTYELLGTRVESLHKNVQGDNPLRHICLQLTKGVTL